MVGFIKGGEFSSGLVLSFTVEVTDGTASKKTNLKLMRELNLFCWSYTEEGANADFTVTNRNLLHRVGTSSNPAVSTVLRVDELAQEIDETFQLTLIPNPATPASAFSGTNEFLQGTITVTIIDKQRKPIQTDQFF